MSALIEEYRRYAKTINKNVFLYYLILLLAAFSGSAFNVLFGIYLKNLGFTEQLVGEILSLMTLGTALGALPVSALAARFSKKRTIVFGLIAMVLSGLLLINIHITLFMQLSAFIYGVGQASVMILQAPILYENTASHYRVTAFSVAFVLQNLAFVISSFLLGHASTWLATALSDATANAVLMNFATLTQLIAIYLTAQFSGPQMESFIETVDFSTVLVHTLGEFKAVLSGGALMYVLQVAFIGFGAGLVVPFFNIYLKYMLSVDDGVVGTIMAISQVGTILGGLIVSPLSRKFGSVKTVLACQLLSIPFLLSISLPQGLIIITISFFFRSSLMNMANPIISNLSMSIVSEEARTSMSSVVAMTGNLFRAFGIYVGGLMMYGISYNSPYYVTIICYLIGTYIFYRTFKHFQD